MYKKTFNLISSNEMFRYPHCLQYGRKIIGKIFKFLLKYNASLRNSAKLNIMHNLEGNIPCLIIPTNNDVSHKLFHHGTGGSSSGLGGIKLRSLQ